MYTSGLTLLGGTLNVDLLSSFVPTLGNSFDLLDWGSLVTGSEFGTLDLPPLSSGLGWDVSSLYVTGVLSVGPQLLGDYNLDGIVDAADFTVWRDALGESVPPYVGADGNGNGAVDSADYDVWKSHFGETVSSVASTLAMEAVVPEPSSWLLAGCLLIGLVVRTHSTTNTQFDQVEPNACGRR